MWVALFGLSTLLVFLLMSLFAPPREEAPRERLQRLVARRKALAEAAGVDLLSSAEPPAPRRSPLATARESVRQAVVGVVERATKGSSVSSRLEVLLLRADWRWKPAEFLIAQAVTAGGGLLLGLLVAPGFSWLLAVLGWAVMPVLLRRSATRQQRLLTTQLPDALAMVANALRSGYSFLQAMDVVSREMPPPISREFALVLKEARVNIPIEEALLHMVERTQSQDMDLVVTAVLIQRQVGGNLSEVLDKIGGTVKERIRLQGEIRTLTSQGRMSGMVVALLPVVLALAMQAISPGFLSPLFTHPVGRLLLVMGVLSQAVGIVVIRRMINMEV